MIAEAVLVNDYLRRIIPVKLVILREITVDIIINILHILIKAHSE